jgi:hypothetical protein
MRDIEEAVDCRRWNQFLRGYFQNRSKTVLARRHENCFVSRDLALVLEQGLT